MSDEGQPELSRRHHNNGHMLVQPSFSNACVSIISGTSLEK